MRKGLSTLSGVLDLVAEERALFYERFSYFCGGDGETNFGVGLLVGVNIEDESAGTDPECFSGRFLIRV